VRENRMHGSRWRREETRPVGNAAQPRRLSPIPTTSRGSQFALEVGCAGGEDPRGPRCASGLS
jgi:hypothetical protein